MTLVKRISHSRLKDYLSCPLLFYYRGVLGLKLPEKPIHLHFGKAFHKGLELKHTEKQQSSEVFKKEFTDEELSSDDLQKYLELREKGIDLLHKYDELEDYLKEVLGIKIIKSEEKIEASNIKDPTTGTPLAFEEIVGVIDFETEDERIGDYKTSGKPYKQEDIDKSLQPTIYYLLYFIRHGRLPNAFIYIVFLKKRKREPIQVLQTQRTYEDITNLINLMNEVYSKVERKLFDRGHDDGAFCDCFRYDELLRIKT